MQHRRNEDIASEPLVARVDDANEKANIRKINAVLCLQNWWRYT